jgi:hypothetical protein
VSMSHISSLMGVFSMRLRKLRGWVGFRDLPWLELVSDKNCF